VNTVGIVGVGLIGGSIGRALRETGVKVLGFDNNPERLLEAQSLGALDSTVPSVVDLAAMVDILVIAAPVGFIADIAIESLDAGAPVVTDVGSVKAPIIDAIESLRPDLAFKFVGGHPMAGSEREGLAGSDPGLFIGATWVLTPTPTTDVESFSVVRELVGKLGAQLLVVPPVEHDALVAMVSHLPQLAASTLMDVAVSSDDDQTNLLRLAAGGFRDMTRIASSHPDIWPDICLANRQAIMNALDEYATGIARVRKLIADGNQPELLDLFKRARHARRGLLPVMASGEDMIEILVPIPDRPGVLAEITTLAGSLNINIVDLQISHSAEGGGGVLSLVVSASQASSLESALESTGHTSSRSVIS